MSVNVVDSKQSHSKCTDISKKFAASIYWVKEKPVLKKIRLRYTTTEGPVILENQSNET
jgi:hypothetical protein